MQELPQLIEMWLGQLQGLRLQVLEPPQLVLLLLGLQLEQPLLLQVLPELELLQLQLGQFMPVPQPLL